jgi:hypothetical protein
VFAISLHSDDESETEDSAFLHNIVATNVAQIIRPNYREEIPKTPLSAYHTTSAIWNSGGEYFIITSASLLPLLGGVPGNFLPCVRISFSFGRKIKGWQ